jgi:phage shock protein PspC (stress-responsive transcriptional regulator)
MLLPASAAFAQDVALIVTFFVAIGLIVNLLIVYIIAGVFAERRDNHERRERGF